MLKTLATILAGHVAIKSLIKRQHHEPISKVIFDSDDRENVTEDLIASESDQKLIDNQRATFIMVNKEALELSEDKQFYTIRYEYDNATMQEQFNLCEEEKFIKEKRLGFCSGIALDNKKALTSGRCVGSRDLSKIALVFNFRANADGTMPTTIPATNVVFPRNLSAMGRKVQEDIDQMVPPINTLGDYLDRGIQDYAIFNLSEQAPFSVPLTVGQKTRNSDIYTLAYPYGLPQKMGSGYVLYEGKQGFITNINMFQGTSGAPIFEKATHKLIGIHSREVDKIFPDFVTREDGTCKKYAVYNITEMFRLYKDNTQVVNNEINIEQFLPFLPPPK